MLNLDPKCLAVTANLNQIKRKFAHAAWHLYFKQHSVVSQKLNLKLECGPMPNVMVALPNIGGALCSMLQSLAYAHY